jgi:sulfur relay (sulfurtransferase) DsrF/TusC family protein
MINDVNVIVRRPLGDERAVLGIRTAYATSAGGYPTSLVMLGDGVYCLVGKLPEYLNDLIKLFLESEGRLACFAKCLEDRGISKDELLFPGIEILDRDDLAEIMEESDSINIF